MHRCREGGRRRAVQADRDPFVPLPGDSGIEAEVQASLAYCRHSEPAPPILIFSERACMAWSAPVTAMKLRAFGPRKIRSRRRLVLSVALAAMSGRSTSAQNFFDDSAKLFAREAARLRLPIRGSSRAGRSRLQLWDGFAPERLAFVAQVAGIGIQLRLMLHLVPVAGI